MDYCRFAVASPCQCINKHRNQHETLETNYRLRASVFYNEKVDKEKRKTWGSGGRMAIGCWQDYFGYLKNWHQLEGRTRRRIVCRQSALEVWAMVSGDEFALYHQIWTSHDHSNSSSFLLTAIHWGQRSNAQLDALDINGSLYSIWHNVCFFILFMKCKASTDYHLSLVNQLHL